MEKSMRISSQAETTTYRKAFVKRWCAAMNKNFPGGVTEIMSAFKVDRATAQNWVEGRNAPQGWAVARFMEQGGEL